MECDMMSWESERTPPPMPPSNKALTRPEWWPDSKEGLWGGHPYIPMMVIQYPISTHNISRQIKHLYKHYILHVQTLVHDLHI